MSDPVTPQVQIREWLEDLPPQAGAGESVPQPCPPQMLVAARKEALPEGERQARNDALAFARVALPLQTPEHAAYLRNSLRAERLRIEQPGFLERYLRVIGAERAVDRIAQRHLEVMQGDETGARDFRVPEIDFGGEQLVAVAALEEGREALL